MARMHGLFYRLESGRVGALLRWVRRYVLALGIGVGGMLLSGVIAQNLASTPLLQDEARFTAETTLLTGMIEQKMERYEDMLSRLRDLCARREGMPTAAEWGFWTGHVLGGAGHYPAMRSIVLAPKVTAATRYDFERRARLEVTPSYQLRTGRTNAAEWLPVWTQQAGGGLVRFAAGTDLFEPGDGRPSLASVLRSRVGWISPEVFRLAQAEGEDVVGFWFGQCLLPETPQQSLPAWSVAGEARGGRERRFADFRAEQALGILAALIDGNAFMREFNEIGGKPRVHVQLYAGTNAVPEARVNPAKTPPGRPLLARDVPMRWYGRVWIARWSSTPLFEADSVAYYRARVALWLGVPLSLLMAGTVGWQTKRRDLAQGISARLREALDRQTKISADLHDGTLQSIYALGLGLRRCQQLQRTDPVQAASRIEQCVAGVQHIIDELREHIQGLATEDVPPARLDETLAAVAARLTTLGEMRVELDLDAELVQALPPRECVHLVNIAREALSNSLRHGQATCASIRLLRSADGCEFVIVDNGQGFAGRPASGGRGLRNMRERAMALAGQCEIHGVEGQGTTVRVRFPFPSVRGAGA